MGWRNIPWESVPWITLAGALLLSLANPVILIVIRNHVRNTRARIVREFENVFDLQENVSFEFAKSKYQGPDKISYWRLYVAAIPFIIISFAGMTGSFMPLRQTDLVKGISTIYEFLLPTMFTNGGMQGESAQYFENVLAIASMAFIGSFLFAQGYLLRAIANFDLAPLTFFRVTLNMLLSIATATILWRTMPDLVSELLPGKTDGGSADKLGLLWYGVAFLIGFFPDLGMGFLVQRIPLPLKRSRDDLLKQCSVASIEIIDGIDVWKRFRLQEVDLVDVQNLAAANPILLFIETPYGFYECFDWVAQAQLCSLAGPDRFIELRRRHIRTVIDFERAVLGPESTVQARQIIAEVLFATGPESKDFFSKWKRPLFTTQQGAAEPPYAYEQYDDATFKHYVKAMLDDLHVHRLRQVWIDISRKLGPKSLNLGELYDMEDKHKPVHERDSKVLPLPKGDHTIAAE